MTNEELTIAILKSAEAIKKDIQPNELLNYITNLQQAIKDTKDTADDMLFELKQENERLKENAIHNDKVVDKARWNEMIYKSRCEKASDNLKRNYWINEHEHNDDVVNMTLNILQNGSDSQ